MTEEIKVGNFERIPIKIRLSFQRVLMNKMLSEKPSDIRQIEWADVYAKRVSDIIDNTENSNIRDLILTGDEEKYKEASEILVKIFDGENRGKAA